MKKSREDAKANSGSSPEEAWHIVSVCARAISHAVWERI